MRINTKHAKILESTGLDRDSAEKHLEVIGESMEGFATKEDLKNVEKRLKENIKGVRIELKQDITDLRTELKQDIKSLEVNFKHEMSDVRKDMQALELRIVSKLAKVIIVTAGFSVTILSGVGLFLKFIL